jgi:hypothetical protein
MEFFGTLIKRPVGKLTISNYNGGLIRVLLDSIDETVGRVHRESLG